MKGHGTGTGRAYTNSFVLLSRNLQWAGGGQPLSLPRARDFLIELRFEVLEALDSRAHKSVGAMVYLAL
jgi:hypothetical protein